MHFAKYVPLGFSLPAGRQELTARGIILCAERIRGTDIMKPIPRAKSRGIIFNMGATWRWYVYIASCKDGTYYVGMTWNIKNREIQHLSGKGSEYTAKHGFKKIEYVEEYESLDTARQRERQLHGWSHNKKKKLIEGEWKKI